MSSSVIVLAGLIAVGLVAAFVASRPKSEDSPVEPDEDLEASDEDEDEDEEEDEEEEEDEDEEEDEEEEEDEDEEEDEEDGEEEQSAEEEEEEAPQYLKPVDPTLVKRTRCHACGAAKVTRSATAYIYCDYCATFIDWDFQLAISDPRSSLPGPAYEAILEELGPELEKAKKRRDVEAYRSLQKRVFETYVEACPASCPPRVKDPAYRKAYVAYQAELAVVRDFDLKASRLTERCTEEAQRAEWKPMGRLGKIRIETEGFWRMFEAYAAASEAVAELNQRMQLHLQDPDRAPPALVKRQGFSTLVQGWLPYLEPADAEALIERAGLGGDYVSVPPPKTEKRHCGGCGAPLTVVEGAQKVLCERCGKVMDAARGEFPCTNCNAPVSLPLETSLFACPYCRTELRAMRWPGMS